MRIHGRLLVGLAVVAGALLASCREKSAGEVRLVLGSGSDEQRTFAVESALAEFVGLGAEGSELRLSLASYRGLDCQRFTPPKPGEYLVTVTVWVPAGQTVHQGEYPWSGIEPKPDPTGRVDGAPRAIPTVRSSRGNHVIRQGGHVELTQVELAPYGDVTGLLAFEYPGTASAPATAITGRFNARMCRFAPVEPESR